MNVEDACAFYAYLPSHLRQLHLLALAFGDDKSFRNFRLSLIECHGCSKELYSRLQYGKMMTERLIAELDSQSSKVSTENQPTPRQS